MGQNARFFFFLKKRQKPIFSIAPMHLPTSPSQNFNIPNFLTLILLFLLIFFIW